MKIKNHIPNFLTLCNLSLGFAAVAQCFCGTFDALCQASYCIVAAALFDFCDGAAARLLHAQSPIGKQLDSLADVVSFGIAPGFVFFQLLNYDLCKEGWIEPPARYLVYAAVLVPIASAIRLARYNTDPTQSVHFRGLPTPAMALVVASIPLALKQNAAPFFSRLFLSTDFILVAILLLSYLMVSPYRIFSMKKQPGGYKNNFHILLLLAGTGILALMLGYSAGFPALLIYLFLSFLFFRNIRDAQYPKG